jgi:hypothetical protein
MPQRHERCIGSAIEHAANGVTIGQSSGPGRSSNMPPPAVHAQLILLLPARRAVASLLLALAGVACPAHADETVRLQLKHTHQFQLAGYYAAEEKGY